MGGSTYERRILTTGGNDMSYVAEFSSLIESVSSAAGKSLEKSCYEIIDRGVPHAPPTQIPDGKMAIYCFIFKGRFLKIGKANAKSSARYCYQHYNPKSANSTLASSILNDVYFANYQLNESNIGEWIKNKCHRVDVLLNKYGGLFTLDFIEKTLQYCYAPKYEGFKSQRD